MKSKESRKPSAKEVESDANHLLQSLREHADHLEGKRKLTLRTTTVVLPPPVKAIKPEEIAGIRHKLNVSLPVFAALLNVLLTTAQNWEQGKRSPSGAALRLLDLTRRRPPNPPRRLRLPRSEQVG